MSDLNRQKASKGNFVPERKMLVVQSVFFFFFFFPLFFQLSGSIFADSAINFDSQGLLTQLPIPIAGFFCFTGIALLLRLEASHFGLGFVFSVFIAMFFAVIFSAENLEEGGLARFILLVQFILPMFGLVLGMLYIRPKNEHLRFEAIVLYVLLLIIPSEVAITLMADSALLSPSVYFFSLYQHLQYLPVVFVGFYFLSVISLSETRYLRYLIVLLAPVIGIYIAASLSALAILLAGAASLVVVFLLFSKRIKGLCFFVVILLWGGFLVHYPAVQLSATYDQKYGQESSGQFLNVAGRLKPVVLGRQESSIQNELLSLLPNNIKERLIYWGFYSKGVFASPKVFVFGHSKRPDRSRYPSAHNYYLDLVYHFGVISFLPFCYLIFMTVKRCLCVMRKRISISSGTIFLMVLVSFFVFIDSSFKVAFRQPYPGMMMFFLWGILLARLSEYENEADTKSV